MPDEDDRSRKAYKRYHARRLPLPHRPIRDPDRSTPDAGLAAPPPLARPAASHEEAARAKRERGESRRAARELDEQAARRERRASHDGDDDMRASWTGVAGPRGGAPAEADLAPRRRTRSVGRRIAIGMGITLLVLLLAVGVWALVGWMTFDSAVDKANARITAPTEAALTPDAGSIATTPTTILILGVDQRGGQPGRSDTIMLVRSNPETKSFSQLSIARDMRVDIPGQGMGKINTGYFWGGAPLAIETVQTFTGVPINHIVIVSFNGFPRFIDALGGIDVDVPQTITSRYSGGRTVTFPKGRQHMDGKTALVYSRIRYADNDFRRQGRQQQVVAAMQERLMRPAALPTLPWTGAKLMKTISTDLTSWELAQLAWRKVRSSPENTHNYVLAGSPATIGGQSYIISDRQGNLAKIDRFVND